MPKILLGFLLLIVFSCILFNLDWVICDLYDPEVSVKWHVLRNKFESVEMFFVLSALIVWMKDCRHFITWKYLLTDVEKSIPVRVVISYWQFSCGDFLDRVFFDVNSFGPNDWFIYGYVTLYLYKTRKIYVATGRKII